MKHVIEMIQNARRLAGPDHPEFLAELDAALHRLNTYDEIKSALSFLGEATGMSALAYGHLVAYVVGDLMAAKFTEEYLRNQGKRLLEENAALKAENEKLAMMVDQRGDAEAASIRPMPVGAAAEKTPDDTIEIVRDALRQGGVCKICEYVGQAWCQTDSKCDGCAVVAFPFRDAPSIVLCNVHRCVETGELTRTPVPINELPRV